MTVLDSGQSVVLFYQNLTYQALFAMSFVFLDHLLCLLCLYYVLCLQPSVDIKTVLARLMERLSNYAALSAEVSNKFNLLQN